MENRFSSWRIGQLERTGTQHEISRKLIDYVFYWSRGPTRPLSYCLQGDYRTSGDVFLIAMIGKIIIITLTDTDLPNHRLISSINTF